MFDKEKRTLTIDVGNSFTKMLVFNGDSSAEFFKVENLDVDLLIELVESHKINRIAYCASGQSDSEVCQFIEKFDHSIILDHNTDIPISISYKTPETLGRDRIAVVCGAHSIFPQQNVAIINMGTCITYDLIDSDSNYLGGNIAPGVYLRLKAMHAFTAGLPLVEIRETTSWIGKTTDEALINGAVLGTQMEIESFIGRTNNFFGKQEKDIDKVKYIFTGGDVEYINKDFLNENIQVEPYLVHIGLLDILNYNE